jgi:hypothetical protein
MHIPRTACEARGAVDAARRGAGPDTARYR